MDLVIVLIFISSQLVDTVSVRCKTGYCSNYGDYREVCNSTSTQCQFTCADDQEIKIFSAAFKVYQGSSPHHYTCGPIADSVWNDWCDDKSNGICNIDESWVNNFTLPASQYKKGTKHLLLIYSCIQENATSGEYSTPDPGSLITGFENFTDYLGQVEISTKTTDSIKNDPAEQGSLRNHGFNRGEIAGIVIGSLVCVGGLALLVVLVLLRQRRLSKRLNELENPVYKDPGLMSTPVIAGSYDNEAYGQVKSNDQGPLDMVYDKSVTNNNHITIYDNNVQAKRAQVPYLEVVAHSNTYDEVTIQPDGPTYSVPDKDKVVPNAPPEDDPPEVPADYDLAQPPVPSKSFITEDTLHNEVIGEDELVDNESYRTFDGEGGDGLVYNEAYHAFADKQGAKDN